MYKLCKTEQSALRQRQLEEELLKAMLVQQYEDISVIDLCARIGLPRKSFYRYFSGKDGALHALIDHRLLDFVAESMPSKGSGRQHMIQELTWVYEFWQGQKPLLDALYRNGLSSVLVSRVTTFALEEQRMDFGLQKLYPDIESRKAAVAFTVCGMMTTVLQWHWEGFTRKPREMAETIYQIMSQPLIRGE